MSISEAVIEKLNALPPEKQQQVLQFVQALSSSGKSAEKGGEPYEWMKIALSMGLDGPPDLSEHLDDYLYGDKKNAW